MVEGASEVTLYSVTTSLCKWWGRPREREWRGLICYMRFLVGCLQESDHSSDWNVGHKVASTTGISEPHYVPDSGEPSANTISFSLHNGPVRVALGSLNFCSWGHWRLKSLSDLIKVALLRNVTPSPMFPLCYLLTRIGEMVKWTRVCFWGYYVTIKLL